MDSPKRTFPFLSWFGWSFATWLALAGAVYGAMNDMNEVPWCWWLVLVMPSASVLSARQALLAGETLAWVARVVFWMFAVAGMALFSIYALGQWLLCTQLVQHSLLIVAAILPILVMILAGIWERRTSCKKAGSGWLLESLAGAACLAALVAAAYFIWIKACVEPLRQKAERRWAEIGHPMPEFQKSLRRVDENQSLRELVGDLKPMGVLSFYKPNTGRGGNIPSDTITAPAAVTDLISGIEPGDQNKLPARDTVIVNSRADDLSRICKGILQRDSPVWETNPYDGLRCTAPNYLTTRILSQWFCADAFCRLEKGDDQGASEVVEAGLRMTQNLGEQPMLVTAMVHCSVQSMFAKVIARLPADPVAMQRLATEVGTTRQDFARTTQWEAWAFMHTVEADPEQEFWTDDRPLMATVKLLPNWLWHRASRLAMLSVDRNDISTSWLFEADVVRIFENVHDLAASDLGVEQMDESERQHSSPYSPNLSRAWVRLNLMLLLREQTELIRLARAQMQGGKTGNLGEWQSVVIPGSKWKITGDAVTNSFTLELAPRPSWTIDSTAAGTVAGSQYFLLPLDGSKPWQLAPGASDLSAVALQNGIR